MEKKPRSYRRLDESDRVAIENGLDKRKSCRQMARELGRSPSTIADEVAHAASIKSPSNFTQLFRARLSLHPARVPRPRAGQG